MGFAKNTPLNELPSRLGDFTLPRPYPLALSHILLQQNITIRGKGSRTATGHQAERFLGTELQTEPATTTAIPHELQLFPPFFPDIFKRAGGAHSRASAAEVAFRIHRQRKKKRKHGQPDRLIA